MHRSAKYILTLGILLLFLMSGVVQASDGRINPPPYHFGGDALYCNQQTGCKLLNMTGQFLWNWPQIDIANAFEMLDKTGQNALVGNGQGTYGVGSLWAVPTDENNGNKKLCFFGFDEWGKQNFMCFYVTTDWNYLPLSLAIGKSVPDCSAFEVGNFVERIDDHSISGRVTSIDVGTGIITFGKNDATASCDQLETVV